MKKITSIILTLSVLLLITACPYRSEVALSDPENSEIDSLLLGQWFGKNIKDSAEMAEVTIQQRTKNEYTIELKSLDTADSLSEKWRGFITKVGNQKILNLLGKEGNYTFIKYTTDGSTLKVSMASDNFIKQSFATPEELLNFFKQNINKKALFENIIVFKNKNTKR